MKVNIDSILDTEGKHVFIEDKSPSIETRYAIMRPEVKKIPKTERKLITMQELPNLLGIGEQ